MTIRVALIAAVCISLAPAAFAQPPAAPAAPAAKAKYSVKETPIVDLLKVPAAKAVLAKHMADLLAQIEANLAMLPPDFTLDTLQQYAPLPPETLKAIDADLAKL